MNGLGRLVFCLIACALVVLCAAPVSASTPATSSGTGTLVFIPNGPPRFADGNVIISATLYGTVSGTLSGTWTEQATEVIHPDGTATAHATGTFFVSTPCGTGSFRYLVDGQQASPTSDLSGRIRSIDDASATLSFHTVDNFSTAPNSGTFSYAGQYSC